MDEINNAGNALRSMGFGFSAKELSDDKKRPCYECGRVKFLCEPCPNCRRYTQEEWERFKKLERVVVAEDAKIYPGDLVGRIDYVEDKIKMTINEECEEAYQEWLASASIMEKEDVMKVFESGAKWAIDRILNGKKK